LTLLPALAAKTAHDFGQFLVERLGLTREACGAAAAHLGDVCDERKGFLCFIQRGGIGDALAALCTRIGYDETLHDTRGRSTKEKTSDYSL
jgi:hypothetical protein